MTVIHALIGTDAHHILWWQECVRAVLAFVLGLAMIRLLGRRAFGEQTPLDILVAVIMGSNLSRAMTANAAFFPTIAASFVLLLVYWLFAHAAARWHPLGFIIKGTSVTLVSDGELDRGAMRRHGVSEADLAEAARRSAIAGVDELHEARLERSGKISVIPRS
ncbi:DUF421 domain-containing protein [Pararhizobium mangrovi]|uniref:DUF421 domain-containing protein n=1 Tax=Pararhizobium mangrovi TaxID=2590452 RepID=A0A506UHP0_9HYPH|nr:YetF domain-containing protein [Pararhizobium mangrovi]TPW32835.1 DUF421 domain-containing protein [Pararhizobium mangrovi]